MIYYLHSRNENTVVLATYDEAGVDSAAPGSASAWFMPYGEGPYAQPVTNDVILVSEEHGKKDDYQLFRVHLKPSWLIRNKYAPLAAMGKPDGMNGWYPYDSKNVYWAYIRQFGPETSIGTAINALQVVMASNSGVSRFYRNMEEDLKPEDIVAQYENIVDWLVPMLMPSGGDEYIKSVLDMALPAFMPPPRMPQLGRPFANGYGETHPRTVWQWRLGYAICYGIALGKLPVS